MEDGYSIPNTCLKYFERFLEVFILLKNKYDLKLIRDDPWLEANVKTFAFPFK